MYDKVNFLGKMLRDSQPSYTENGSYIAPLTQLSREAQMSLQSDIKTLCQKTSKYLDQSEMRANKPLWHYDRKNPETHISSSEFRYGHLLP